MNIVFFTHEKQYGGASRALVTLIKDLKKENNVYVVIPFKDAKIKEELDKMGIQTIYSFYSWWQQPNELGNLKKIIFKVLYHFNFISYFRLQKKIKKLNPDIIHSNTSVIDIGCRLANKLNVKHVWHFREFTGKHLKFIKGDSESYNFINKNAGKIIYISKAIQEFYEEKIDSNLGVLIYDGISKDYLIEKKYKETKTVTFLLASTLEKNKGQLLALKSSKILLDRGIKNFKLVLAGGNPSGYLDELNEYIKNSNLDKNVEYVGFVKDMNALRKKVQVELMCAPREAFGLVTAEAMLAGNVVIGSNSGATKEIVLDGKTGYLYEKENPISLADKMEKIIKNRDLIQKFGKNGQRRILKNFTSEKNFKEMEKLYRNLGVM